MKIILKANWFAGKGKEAARIRRSASSKDVRTVDDSLFLQLPKSAKIVEGPKVVPDHTPQWLLDKLPADQAAHEALEDGKGPVDERAPSAQDMTAALKRAAAASKGNNPETEGPTTLSEMGRHQEDPAVTARRLLAGEDDNPDEDKSSEDDR